LGVISKVYKQFLYENNNLLDGWFSFCFVLTGMSLWTLISFMDERVFSFTIVVIFH
jgi:hypothetical protein